MIIPNILKLKWENATITAIWFCVANAANMAVIVVPILAPIVYGNNCRIVIRPAPANGMISEVVIELL